MMTQQQQQQHPHRSYDIQPPSSSSSSSNPGWSSTDYTHHHPAELSPSSPIENRFRLSSLVLITTLDGQLHALDRSTGIWNWTLSDPDQIDPQTEILIDRHNGLIQSHPPNLTKQTSSTTQQTSNHFASNNDGDHHYDYDDQDADEFYAIEPQNDGDLYVFIRSPPQADSTHKDGHRTSSHRLEKLPISVSQLVNLSPFTFPNRSSKMFIGKKESHLLAIDLTNGHLLNILDSNLKIPSSSSNQHNSSYAPQNNHSQHSSSRQSPIDNRPQDLLYIGRTDYQISIYAKPNKLVQTLRYSTYTPSNLGTTLQSRWSTTPDDLYLEPTHDGNLICFETASDPQHSSHKIKWQNSFDHPVTSVFDLVFPLLDLTTHSPPSPSTERHTNGDDHGQHLPSSPNLQQPVLFVQPKFSPFRASDAHQQSSAQRPLDLFDQLKKSRFDFSNDPSDRPTSSSSSSSVPKVFLGKFNHSFYVMSQKSYPLVALAPSASYPGLESRLEPLIGTHPFLDSNLARSFFHLRSSDRLLDPTPFSHSDHPPLALDPSPEKPALPPPTGSRDSGPPTLNTPSPLPPISRPPESPPAQLTRSKTHEMSMSILGMFKDQLIPSAENSTTGATDDRSLSINPILSLLFVVMIMSWWAGKKMGSHAHSDSRFRLPIEKLDDLFHIDNVKKGIRIEGDQIDESNDRKTAEGVGCVRFEQHPDQGLAQVRNGNISQIEDEDTAVSGTGGNESNPDQVKSKPKRRRGKRPGQKAAAKARLEAEAAAKLANNEVLDDKGLVSGNEERRVGATPQKKNNKKPKSNPPGSVTPKPTSKKSNTTRPRSSSVSSSVSSSSSVGSPQNNPHQQQTGQLNVMKKRGSKKLIKQVGFDEIAMLDSGKNLEDLGPNSLSLDNGSGDDQDSLRVGSLIVTDETIGYGSHGTVVLKGKFQGRQVAVKRLLKDFVTLAIHEVGLLQESDDHPNVIRYFVKESMESFLYIGLELCNGSLFDLMEKKKFEGSDELMQIFDPKKALKQITSGLKYLHKLKIVHRDIKPQNILISLKESRRPSSVEGRKEQQQEEEDRNEEEDEEEEEKKKKRRRRKRKTGQDKKQGNTMSFRMLISDFGLCKKLEIDESSFAQTTNHATGSFGYRAPEILRGQVDVNEPSQLTASSSLTSSTSIHKKTCSVSSSEEERKEKRLTRSIDIFSLGCIYYYVLTKGEHPFGSKFEREVKILRDEVCLDQLDGFGDQEAYEAKELISSMIRSDPQERPTAQKVLIHPYFWGPNKRLNFLCDSSDRFEIMERGTMIMNEVGGEMNIGTIEKIDERLIELERGLEKYQYKMNSMMLVGMKQIGLSSTGGNIRNGEIEGLRLDWYKKLDKCLIENLGKYRKYDGSSIRDLLRVLRNKKHHFQDLSDQLKKTLGEIPEGYLNYFLKRFPWLLIHVYEIIKQFKIDEEVMFKSQYFICFDDFQGDDFDDY